MNDENKIPRDFTVEPLIPEPKPANPAPIPAPANPNRYDKIMGRINHPRSNRVLKWLVVVALLLFIVAVAMFWFGNSSFSERDVVLLLEGPSQAASGDEVTYKIKYRNNTKVELHSMEFRFFYPDDSIVITESSFSDDLSHGFNVDTLSPGQEGELELKAFMVGDKGNIKTARVSMIFRAGNITSSFEKSESVSTTIISVPVPMTLVAPPTAVSSQELSYILDYRNESGSDISDLRFEFTYPEGFAIRRTSPQATSGNNVWDVALVRQGSGSRITVTGVLTGQERENKAVSVLLKRKLNDQYINYERATSSTIISSPLITTSISVNGSRDTVTYPGDSLLYAVQYRNTSTYSLIGMNLTVRLEGDMFDLGTLDTRGGYYDSATKTITWNAGIVPEFGTLGPNRGGQVNFQIRLKPTLTGPSGSRNYSVKVTSNFGTTNVPTGIDADQIATDDTLLTKISTEPVLATILYYQESIYSSFGPIPPKVGQKTIYTVYWQVTNPGNDMNSTVVKAILPPGVAWENATSVSGASTPPTYNSNNAQITWNIGILPAGVRYEGIFRVSITPSTAQKGKPMTLLGVSTLTSTDSFTQQPVQVTSPGITTDNTVDRPGQGTVE